MSQKDIIEVFVADVCAGKCNMTPVSYRRKLKQFLAWFGPRGLESLTADDLNKFKNHLLTRKTITRGHRVVKGSLSIWTVRSILMTTKHFCRWLKDNHYIERNPAERFKLPKEPPMQPKYVDASTVDKLLAATHTVGEDWERVRNYAIVLFLRDTGGRASGLLNTSIDHLDLELGEIEVLTKNHVSNLYVNPPTIEAIKAWLDIRPTLNPTTEKLFVSRAGRELAYGGLRWILKRLAKHSGCLNERHNPHAFRHAFARDLLKSNKANLSQVSQLLDHSSITITAKYYARWETEELRQVHRKASPVQQS